MLYTSAWSLSALENGTFAAIVCLLRPWALCCTLMQGVRMVGEKFVHFGHESGKRPSDQLQSQLYLNVSQMSLVVCF